MLLAACVLVPWQRFGPLAPLVIPVLDLVAIGLLRDGSSAGLPDPGVLSVLPVVWISASTLSAPASLSLSFTVPLLAALPWLLTDPAAPPAARSAEAVLVPLMMLAVSLAMRFARARLRHEQWRIKSTEAELQALLADSRERERLLNTILDTVDVGIVAVDAGGRRLLTNSWQTELEESAASAAAGRRSTAQPEHAAGVPQPPEEEGQLVLTGQDRSTPLPLERRPIRRALAGESFADYLVCFGEAAASRVVSTGARPLKNDAGDFRGAVVVFNEVTGLVDALAAKDEVVSTVSHEFRTPLTSIIGNLDLVLADTEGLDSPAVRRIEVAQRNAERLLALVSDLLMSASSAVHVHPRRTDLAGLVEASLGSAQAQAQASRVCLAMDVPGPLWANVDPLRISQALDNLVSNAIKYSPDGGSVRVSASTGRRPGAPPRRRHRHGHDRRRRRAGLHPFLPQPGRPGRFDSGSGPGAVHHEGHRGTARRLHLLPHASRAREHVHAGASRRRSPGSLLGTGGFRGCYARSARVSSARASMPLSDG